jgi:hypothetical protein
VSIGLATKGVICFGGGGSGGGEPYPVYIEVISDLSVDVEVEDEFQVLVMMEEPIVGVEMAAEQEMSLEVEGEVEVGVIEVTDDDVEVGVELETQADIWIWSQPYSMTVNYGTLACGGVTNLYAADGNIMQVDEVPGSDPGFNIRLLFINVPGGSKNIFVDGYYDGNPAHNVKLQIYNYTTPGWEDVTGDVRDFPSESSQQSYQFTMPSPSSDYISGSQVGIRIRHTSTGSAGHYMYLDRVYLG